MEIENGRLVARKPKNTKSTATTQRPSTSSSAAQGLPPTSTAQPRLARIGVPTVCDLLGASPAPAQLHGNTAHDDKDELASTPPVATKEHEYIEHVKRNVDTGVVDLHGDPWIRPCDPHIAASRLTTSGTSGSKQIIDSAQVRGIVLRPLIFMWAPHLLPPWPFGRRDDLACMRSDLNSQTCPSRASMHCPRDRRHVAEAVHC